MKVILLDNIKGVGKKDEVITASDGYARNFLFPKKLAVEASSENMNQLKAKKDSANHKKELEKDGAKQVQKQLEKIRVRIKVKTGENGKVFGGITAKEISEQLENQYEIKIDKKKVELKETIKVLGNTSVDIKLYEGVIGKLKIEVLPE